MERRHRVSRLFYRFSLLLRNGLGTFGACPEDAVLCGAGVAVKRKVGQDQAAADESRPR